MPGQHAGGNSSQRRMPKMKLTRVNHQCLKRFCLLRAKPMMSAVPWICLSIPSTGTQGLCLLPSLGWTTCSPARSCKSPQRRGICRFPHLTSPLSFLPSSQDHCSSLHFLVVQSHDSIINVPAPVAQRAYPSLWFTRSSELLPSWLWRGDSLSEHPFFLPSFLC